MSPTAVIDAEIEAARKAGDKARERELQKGRRLILELRRWMAAVGPSTSGLALDSLPRQPVKS